MLTFAVLTCCAFLPGCSQPQNTEGIEQVSNDEDSFTLKIYDQSETLNRIVAVNASGAVLGMREDVSDDGGFFNAVYFYDDGKTSTDIAIPEGYTNIDLTALSDSGIAIGYASREIGHVDGSLTALLWDSKTKVSTNLGKMPDDNASQAQGISADGKRIVGYSTGSDPMRLRPCVWDWNEVSQAWDVRALPTLEEFNPYLMSGGAIVSPNGNRIAACATEAFLENGIVDSSLFVWDLKDGQWTRTKVCDDQMRLHAMNDGGIMAGDINDVRGRLPCRIDLEGNVTRLGLLPGDVAGEAWGIDPRGVIVGLSDDPHGPEGGPQACVWKEGKESPLPLPDGCLFGMAVSINSKGQIAGMTDMPFSDKLIMNPETGEEEPLIKAVGFVWTAKD
jgi:uncharacterized membrane protein